VDKFYKSPDKLSTKLVWKIYCFEKWGEVFFND